MRKQREPQGNDRILELSYGETRRSSVQIRPAPPNSFFNEIKLMELIIWTNNLKEAVFLFCRLLLRNVRQTSLE